MPHDETDALPPSAEEGGMPWISLLVTTVTLVLLVLTGWMSDWGSGTTSWAVAFSLTQVVTISIIIWQACDPFADAAQWLGAQWRIPGSVRGATLDAIASSLPELFTGIFFVVVAIWSSSDSSDAQQAAGSEGFGATVATCAGSAVYNMMLIPAFCGLVIAACRKEHPTIEVEPQVITRDGLWFLGTQLVLVAFLFQNRMDWWMAVVLIAMYLVYVLQLIADARSFQKARRVVTDKLAGEDEVTTDRLADALRAEGIRPSLSLIDQLRREQSSEDEEDETAGVLFGMIDIRLNTKMAWTIITISTLIAAVACYWLVAVTKTTADILEVPLFFVAVILAAAASSVPDTFLSIGAAKRGDDDGAVSNAFGSNIFDICICLSVPLLLGCYLNGWQPIELTENGEPMRGLVGLRALLVVLTVVTLLVLWQNLQLNRKKSWILVGLYLVFVGYAVAGSLGWLPA